MPFDPPNPWDMVLDELRSFRKDTNERLDKMVTRVEHDNEKSYVREMFGRQGTEIAALRTDAAVDLTRAVAAREAAITSEANARREGDEASVQKVLDLEARFERANMLARWAVGVGLTLLLGISGFMVTIASSAGVFR